MDITAWLIIASFVTLCLAAWLWLRQQPKREPLGDDWGGKL